MKEQIKTSGKKLSNEEIANLSEAEFKALVIKILTELVEYGHKIEGKMKTMKSEIKENVQGTNNDGKETRTQVNDLEQKEETNIQPEQNEETGIQKMRRGLGTSGTTSRGPTFTSKGCQKKNSKELETYLKK